MAPPQDLLDRLAAAGQEHLLTFWDDLSLSEQETFRNDIDSIDFNELNSIFNATLISNHHLLSYRFSSPTKAQWTDGNQSSVVTEQDSCFLTRLRDFKPKVTSVWYQHGLKLLADEKVGAVIMAGGQGTRLGWHKPKGTFPIGPVSNKSLFQLLAERHLAVRRLSQTYSKSLALPKAPLYIMTSDNHAETEAFFETNNFFGLDRDDVIFFEQQTLACLSIDGKILLEEKGKISRSPNGNGGIFTSMHQAGIVEDMKRRGLVGIHVFGIDNALMKVLDPTFIGYVDICQAPIGNKCILKTNPDEKVGIMVKRRPASSKDSKDDVACVVEYSDLPLEMQNLRSSPDSSLDFSAGNICNHYFRVDFIQDLLQGEKIQTFCTAHAAHKKIPYINLKSGARTEPTQPNGIKIEYFVFDCFPLATSVAALEVARETDFAPVKNAIGEDSPASCQKMMTNLYRHWLAENGWKLEGDGPVEISPLRSYEGEGLDKPEIVKVPVYLL